jgi:hypothetical protein
LLSQQYGALFFPFQGGGLSKKDISQMISGFAEAFPSIDAFYVAKSGCDEILDAGMELSAILPCQCS